MDFFIKALSPRERIIKSVDDSLNWTPDDSEYQFLKSRGFRCECCGLVSRPHKQVLSGYMEIFSVDGGDFVLCSVCAQSQFLSRPINNKANHGLIIYCPSLSQAEISKLAIWAYVARYRKSSLESGAKELIRLITSELVSPIENIIQGFSTGDVQDFSEYWQFFSPKVIDNSSIALRDLKYWPNESVFGRPIRYWSHESVAKIPFDI